MPTSLNNSFELLARGVRESQISRAIFLTEGPIDSAATDEPSESSNGRVHVVRISVSAKSAVNPNFYVDRLKFWIRNQLEPRAHLMQFHSLHLAPDDSQLTIFTGRHRGNIMEYITSNPDCDRFVLLRDLLTGLDWLHQRDFIHGDIRASNIFVKPDGQCYFGEFSPTRTPTRERLLSESWLAPELFNPRVICDALIDRWRDYYGEFRAECDLFAFGCLIVQVYTGELPSPQRYPIDKKLDQDGLLELRRHRSPKEQECVPAGMQSVISYMLSYHPTARRTSTDLMKALWVKNPGDYMRKTASVPYVMAKYQMRRLWRSGYLRD
ncbi:hypothetical protein D9756_002527 [Leucocoprinus leucothites]|uniref:Protein kinase domain-containing protein n=1 Tax=Leucocoprinus leucothites TaxID=201217 RepID=A0A8H5GC34_9AGAR|nr:hypothetical protein D9756_002527 [Leucoagaricus leucothites]